MMRKTLEKACLSLLLITGAVTGLTQQRDQDPRQARDERHQPADPRGQRPEGDRGGRDGRSQAEQPRQGRLSPEERQALRRQIDEAGHDIYRSRR
ncbi:hypothetical protein KTQ42_06925|uniref:hypothetical protein n=1 Tax=Noviherbaspirillum sp. L7-7A TaxID=2850560 RepID=UPI001C2C6830|nr:hypothetical protein [Noviherbaspirillum sp. L7-7A]MBV0879038.1 hypothetical protein [Noviherbaspirillum sp. L7-7A]